MAKGKFRLVGVREAKAAFKAAPRDIREAVVDATEETAVRIADGARGRVVRDTGALASKIGHTINRKTGIARVGIRGGTVGSGESERAPSRTAHLVEFGSVNNAATPFLVPSAEEEREAYLSRIKAGVAGVEQRLASVGGRYA